MENNIEELKQTLEELYRTQQARLDVGADDLDIREAIAEVEEEIKELQDDTNVDRENSIKNERSSMEETIKTIEKMIKSYKEADKCGLSNNDFKNEIKALEHILSDYKRILKENEILNEEKEQAWEEWNNIEQESYKIEQKLKQQIKESQKENEELKSKNKTLEELLQGNLYELYKYYKELAGTYQGNSIPVQKIKDKIEELDIAILECEYSDDDDELYKKAVKEDKVCLLNQKRVLKELLKEEK